MATIIPYSEACERNKDPILEVLQRHFDDVESVLEVGTGTAQHAIYFANHFPELSWQTSDQTHYLDGIHAQLENKPTENVVSPLTLDVTRQPWPTNGTSYDAIYTANTMHIMTEAAVRAFFAGLNYVAQTGTLLVIYGPFKYREQFTSDSNQAFDARLQARGEGSAIRDFEWLNEMAKAQKFSLLADHAMPANNQCLVWRR